MPEFRLVRAALSLFFKDADDYLHELTTTQADVRRERKEAFNDLLRCGKMTRRLADLNDLDPQYLSYYFRRYVRRYYSEVQPEADTWRNRTEDYRNGKG